MRGALSPCPLHIFMALCLGTGQFTDMAVEQRLHDERSTRGRKKKRKNSEGHHVQGRKKQNKWCKKEEIRTCRK